MKEVAPIRLLERRPAGGVIDMLEQALAIANRDAAEAVAIVIVCGDGSVSTSYSQGQRFALLGGLSHIAYRLNDGMEKL